MDENAQPVRKHLCQSQACKRPSKVKETLKIQTSTKKNEKKRSPPQATNLVLILESQSLPHFLATVHLCKHDNRESMSQLNDALCLFYRFGQFAFIYPNDGCQKFPCFV